MSTIAWSNIAIETHKDLSVEFCWLVDKNSKYCSDCEDYGFDLATTVRL